MTRNAPTPRRRGVTLIEVLTAIFIMAIGLMALMTLFPLGALSMAQAVKDDRTGTAARNAEALFRAYWRSAVRSKPPSPKLRQAMLNYPPLSTGLDSRAPEDPKAAVTRGPSYPIYVDGFGRLQQGEGWVAGKPDNIRRLLPEAIETPPSPATTQLVVFNYFSSPDDLSMGQNGRAIGPAIERERRYSWAYLVRQLEVQNDRWLELTVVVYANRSMNVNIDLLYGESAYPATFTKGSNTATVSWGAGQEKPAIRRGGWVLDATMPRLGDKVSKPRGFFYRVLSVTDGSNIMELELETPAREGDGGVNQSVAMVLEGVVEVFERGVVSE